MTGKIRVVKRDTPYRGYTQRRLRNISVGHGLPTLQEMQTELEEYMDILMGREDAPIQGAHALMETADMYYARASELIMMIQRGEADGTIQKGSELTKFRTGELRTFQELAKAASALGSRRITTLSVEVEQAKLGRESS